MAYERRGVYHEMESRLSSTPGLRLSELAVASGVSESSVRRAVREATGLSFRDWRGGVLVAMAEELLASKPSTSLKEIAMALGFDSPRSFRRFIRAAAHLSPSALRHLVSARREAAGAP